MKPKLCVSVDVHGELVVIMQQKTNCFGMMGISPKAQTEKKEWEVKFEATLARFEKLGDAAVPPLQSLELICPPHTSPDIEETQQVVTQEPMHPVFKLENQEPKDFPPAVDIKTLPESDYEDPKFYCFRQSYKLHLIKDCDLYNCVDSVPCKSKAASVPAGSRNSSASVTADGTNPATSRNRPAVNSAGRPKPTERVGHPAGWSKRPAPVSAGSPVSAGWLNPAARPYFRPSSVYFNNMYWSNLYDPMYMNKGRWGTAVKTSAGYSWRNKRPQFWGSKSNGGSHQSTWFHT
ncbi:hypothetical protein Tco_0919415 [Tanacetum coccineum]